jgi:coenzyme F420-0:L-glutamate ligase/coenzyme F420-1:gamma-L-glutamate ligase
MSDSMSSLRLDAVAGIPAIQPGDDLAAIIGDTINASQLTPVDSDVLVISHKVVSKAQGRYVDLSDVTPSAEAQQLALDTEKDPRLVEVVLSQSRAVLRSRPGLIIVEHKLGFVCANAGLDQSNISGGIVGERVLLLPEDPDGSAEQLRVELQTRFGVNMAVIICDSVGRAWRYGVVGLAIGAAGLPSLMDLRGAHDREGRELLVTTVGFADQIASAAELLMGEGAEGQPVVLVRGLRWSHADLPAAALVRDGEGDLFR